jgi:hypothetical protein
VENVVKDPRNPVRIRKRYSDGTAPDSNKLVSIRVIKKEPVVFTVKVPKGKLVVVREPMNLLTR